MITLDPGPMEGEGGGGRLMGDDTHWFFTVLFGIFAILGPLLKVFKKGSNPPEVPAKMIADILGSDKYLDQTWKIGLYFVLDDEVKSNALSLDTTKQDQIWKVMSDDLGFGQELPIS
jgi:hypothetical protein